MTKIKTFCFWGLTLFSLCFSCTALAHTGFKYSENMHSILHIGMSISVVLAFMAAGYLLLKRIPKGIKTSIKQEITK